MLVPSMWDPRSEAGGALLAASWALPEENMDLPCLELSGPAKSPARPSPGERSSGEAGRESGSKTSHGDVGTGINRKRQRLSLTAAHPDSTASPCPSQ